MTATALKLPSHLDDLEAESIHIFREVQAAFRHPVTLYSIGKDSSVLLHLLRKAFYPAKPPMPLLHVDTTWKFREMIAFRDQVAAAGDVEVLVHINQEGVRQGISPLTHGATVHTDVMKTQALKQALDKYAFDAAIGGARRDEEKSRAKERVFSFRNAQHRWDPKNLGGTTWIFSSCSGILELRRGIQDASCVGPGKSNLPFELRRKAGDCSRVTAGPIDLM